MARIIPAERRIERAHVQIMKHDKFCLWSGLLYLGKWNVVDSGPITTAAVDLGCNVHYRREFVDGLVVDKASGIDKFLNYVVLHETGHKAMSHLSRYLPQFKDPKTRALINIAADEVVNNMLAEIDPNEEFCAMPRQPDGKPVGWCHDKYRGWSVAQVYKDMLKNGHPDTGQPMNGQGQGFDEHLLDGEETLTPEELKELQDQVEQALRTGAYMAGKNGNTDKRLLGDLLEPQVRWQDQMAEFVSEVCTAYDEATWARPHRRFIGEDIYLPSPISECVGEVVLLFDVSGSVGHRTMTVFMSEGKSICLTVRPTRLRVIYWDTVVCREEIYEPGEYDTLEVTTKPVAVTGGTDITAAAEYVAGLENIACAVVLTDGYLGGGWGEWGSVPTLWAITSDQVSGVGRTIHIKDTE